MRVSGNDGGGSDNYIQFRHCTIALLSSFPVNTISPNASVHLARDPRMYRGTFQKIGLK